MEFSISDTVDEVEVDLVVDLMDNSLFLKVEVKRFACRL